MSCPNPTLSPAATARRSRSFNDLNSTCSFEDFNSDGIPTPIKPRTKRQRQISITTRPRLDASRSRKGTGDDSESPTKRVQTGFASSRASQSHEHMSDIRQDVNAIQSEMESLRGTVESQSQSISQLLEMNKALLSHIQGSSSKSSGKQAEYIPD